MHVVLPELDGRVLAGAVAFKHPLPAHEGLAFTALANRPEPDRIDDGGGAGRRAGAVAGDAAQARRIAVLMPDYPGAPGRTGYAVGLDVPASVLALLDDLRDAGYAVGPTPPTSRALLDALDAGPRGSNAVARCLCAPARSDLPAERRGAHQRRLGRARRRSRRRATARFGFRARAFGNITGRAARPTAGAPASAAPTITIRRSPPRHALRRFRALAAACREGRCAGPHGGARHARMAARQGGGADRVVLSRSRGGARCRCSIRSSSAIRARPRRPSAASPRSRSAICRRRWSAPSCPARRATWSGWSTNTPRPTASTAAAASASPASSSRPRSAAGWRAKPASLADVAPDEALRRIDAWLCDLKDLAIKDGLHVYGRGAVPSVEATPSPHALTAPSPRLQGRA